MPRPLVINPLRKTDTYKDSHWCMIHPGCTEMEYYYEARGGEYPYSNLFGLQYDLISNFEGPFFTKENLEEERENMKQHIGPWFPYNYDGWKHILDDHGALMPFEIKAVKEGTPVPVKNVMWNMKNTCPKCVWVPGWVETVLEQVVVRLRCLYPVPHDQGTHRQGSSPRRRTTGPPCCSSFTTSADAASLATSRGR